jgi:hypothetical protein
VHAEFENGAGLKTPAMEVARYQIPHGVDSARQYERDAIVPEPLKLPRSPTAKLRLTSAGPLSRLAKFLGTSDALPAPANLWFTSVM